MYFFFFKQWTAYYVRISDWSSDVCSSDLRCFAALDLPPIVPPGWVFALAWTIIYICLGLALAMILHARGAKGRGFALLLFFVQLIANFAWSPLFFGQHPVTTALYLIIFILMVTIATAFAFAPIRKAAAWLLVPSLAWLSFRSEEHTSELPSLMCLSHVG